MVYIAAGPMLGAVAILTVMYEILDKLAFALSGPRIFHSAYRVSWHCFMHTMCQGMVLAAHIEEACIHACA